MRPTEVPALRDEFLKIYGQREARALFLSACEDYGIAGIRLDRASIESLYMAEMVTFEKGDLYYVSAEMSALASAAGATLPTFDIQVSDLPSPFGVMVFDRPVYGFDEHNPTDGSTFRVEVIGASWSVGVSDGVQRLYVCTYTDRDAMTSRMTHSSRLIHDNEWFMPFGEATLTPEQEVDGSVDAVRPIVAAWLLMNQPGVAAIHQHEPTAQERAILKRRRRKSEPIRVVTLRYAPSGGGQSGSREYRHRWAVRGHWRRQWYPSRNGHLPIWISPYIKGPDGAPLMTGEKVYAWRR